MIKIEFTEEEMQALKYERYNHPHPRVQRKMEALWLKSQGMSHNDMSTLLPALIKEAMAKIEELTGIKRSENRVREFLTPEILDKLIEGTYECSENRRMTCSQWKEEEHFGYLSW